MQAKRFFCKGKEAEVIPLIMTLLPFLFVRRTSVSKLKENVKELGKRGRWSLYFVLTRYRKTKKPVPMYETYDFLKKRGPIDVVGFNKELEDLGFVDFVLTKKGVACVTPVSTLRKKDQMKYILEVLEEEGIK